VDIEQLKLNLADMLGGLYVLDVSTHQPTTVHTRAFAHAPFTLAETDLPLWVVFSRAATYPTPPPQTENRLYPEARDFELVLFVAVAQTGTDGEAEARTEPYIDYCRDWIQRHILLYENNPPVPWVQRSYLTRDTGSFVRKWAPNDPTQYIGVSYMVRVEGLNRVTYGSQ
jgi:hypothetical protein